MEVIIRSALHSAHQCNHFTTTSHHGADMVLLLGIPRRSMAYQVSGMSISLSRILCLTHFKVLAVFISDTIHQALITHSGKPTYRTDAFAAFGWALISISTSLRLPRVGHWRPNSAWRSCLVSTSCALILPSLIALQESHCK